MLGDDKTRVRNMKVNVFMFIRNFYFISHAKHIKTCLAQYFKTQISPKL